MVTEDLAQVRRRPGMYIGVTPLTDGAAIYGTFVRITYGAWLWEHARFVAPAVLWLRSCGEHHSVAAAGGFLEFDETSGLAVLADFGGTAGLVDWLFKSRTFDVLAALVYCTEFCLADVSVQGEHFRQMFYRGQATSYCERKPLAGTGMAPYIRLAFTMAPHVFQSSTIGIEQVKAMRLDLRKFGMSEWARTLRITTVREPEGFGARIQ